MKRVEVVERTQRDNLLLFLLFCEIVNVRKKNTYKTKISLTFSWWRPLSYRNQSTDLGSKSMDWFLYDAGLRHERVKTNIFWNLKTLGLPISNRLNIWKTMKLNVTWHIFGIIFYLFFFFFGSRSGTFFLSIEINFFQTNI